MLSQVGPGARETDIMRMVGMKTRSIFERYNITDDATLKEGAECLVGYYSENATAERKVIALGQSKGKVEVPNHLKS